MSKRIILTLIVFSFFLMFSCTEPVLIIPSKSDNSYLSSITVDGTQIENFSSNSTDYYIKTASNRIVIDGTKVNQNASVTGFGARDLALGKNRITISVYSESDKSSTFYYLYVYHYNDSSAYLTDLKIDGDSINDFASDKYVYNRRIEKNVSTLIEAVPANPGSTVTGAGVIKLDLSSDTINLKISVTSKDASSTLEYTIIFNRSGFTGFYNVTDLSYEFQKDGYKTVIFGDSLSVGYGFFNGQAHSEAKDTYPGIMSWSHMVRDAIVRSDPDFIHADQLMIGTKSSSVSLIKSYSGNGADSPEVNYWMPFNNRNIVVTNILSSDEVVAFRYTVKNHTTKKAVLYFSRTPHSVGCSFDIYVNNVLKESNFDTASHDKNYFNGYEVVTAELTDVPLGDNEIKLTNFKNTTTLSEKASSMGFFMLGVGSKSSPVYLTGKSGVTTKFYVDDDYKELKSRVIDHNPDLAIFIIGANDSSNPGGIPSGKVSLTDYYTNLENIVKKIREKNKYCQILLISPPLWNGIDKDYIISYGYKMSVIAWAYNCAFLDTVKLFENFPAQNDLIAKWRDWRVDAIHFTHYGNTIMARSILNKLAPYSPFPREFIDADMVFTESNNIFIPEHGWMIVKYDDATKIFEPVRYDWNWGRNFIKGVKKVAGSSVMEISTFKTNIPGMPKLEVQQFGSNSYEYYTRSETFWTDYQKFWILKRGYSSDGTNIPYILSDADYTAQAEHLKFVISW